jgi:hypothetical protein
MTFACFSALSHVQMSHFLNVRKKNIFFFKRTARRKQEDLEREERIRISHSTPGSRSRAEEYMETSFMSESGIDTDGVEETVTQVLTQFVQDGGDHVAMSVQKNHTGAHAFGVKHHQGMTCFIIRRKVLRRSHICWTCRNTVSPRNG